MAVLVCVFFAERIPLYYSEIVFSHDGFFTHFEFGHGPLYILQLVAQIAYFIACFVMLARKLRRTCDRNEKKQIYFLIVMLIANAGNMLFFLTDITQGYDTTGIGEFISAVLLVYGFYSYDLFNTIEAAKAKLVDSIEIGILIVGNADNVLYCNILVEKLFPGISENSNVITLKSIQECQINNKNLFLEDKVYSVKREHFGRNGKVIVVYLFSDVTESYNYASKLEQEVEIKTRELREIQRAMVMSFANLVEMRDGSTGQHIKNTSGYVFHISNAIRQKDPQRLSEAQVAVISEAAALHDIGKISISDSILCKTERLTDEEYIVMKTHSEIGANIIFEILRDVGKNEYLEMARDMAHYHHERWDGKGYPTGRKGDDIPLSARIMAVADVYDALRSERCYKKGFGIEKSLEIIREGAGTQFDPEIVDIFLENIHFIEQNTEG